jgi:hypothetical protein
MRSGFHIPLACPLASASGAPYRNRPYPEGAAWAGVLDYQYGSHDHGGRITVRIRQVHPDTRGFSALILRNVSWTVLPVGHAPGNQIAHELNWIDSGPGRPLSAEYKVHGFTAQAASDRSDLVLAWIRHAAGASAAR